MDLTDIIMLVFWGAVGAFLVKTFGMIFYALLFL